MPDSGKTALVLSAGGMFGAYQAGVWDALWQRLQPDIVVGASVGSLNGWRIATGCTGPDLVKQWLQLDGISRLKWRFPRGLCDGLLDAANLEATIREMCADCAPRCEFGVVVTECRTLRPRLFHWPEINWTHLAASCSVPVFLPQRLISGIRYCDGGLLDPLPLWAAVRMGASRIIAVNVLKHRPWLLRAIVRGLQAWSGVTSPPVSGIQIVEISPSAPLGSARDTMYWSEKNATRWTQLGRKDAESRWPAVVECLERENSSTWPCTVFTD